MFFCGRAFAAVAITSQSGRRRSTEPTTAAEVRNKTHSSLCRDRRRRRGASSSDDNNISVKVV